MVGREGPNVHIGGGAGLTAAFNAPLSGLIFMLEELERRCSSVEFFVAAIACLTADMVCRALLGQNPVFHIAITEVPPLNQLAVFIPLGILAGGLGVLFNQAVVRGQKLVRLPSKLRWIWWLALALMFTIVAVTKPELLGGGQNLINALLNGARLNLQAVISFWLVRFALTVASASSGAAGGIFMPILALGALLGWAADIATRALFPALAIDTQLFIVVGMAAYFSASVQAPLTGIVLMVEMTANYDLILPLFIGSFTALLATDIFKSRPIYEALMDVPRKNSPA